jgi:filamentous hemagglutinin family protein
MLCASLSLASGATYAGGALPAGGQYVAGQGAITSSSNGLTVNQTGSHGIIDWQSFSIGSGNTVFFNNGNGATLNRVTGGNLSQIDGMLSSTGSVYLINPNGVVIGPGGKVVTSGSFIASTRDLSNDAFLSGGTYQFAGIANGNVTNSGSITSDNGDVVLIGRSVTNSGSVRAKRGTAALAAGDGVVLRPVNGDQRIAIASGSGSVTNKGTVDAAAVELKAADGNVYALAGSNGGIVRATGTQAVGGHIWLTSNGGDVKVTGTLAAANADGSGGTVTVRGANIDVPGRIDASATASGQAGGNVSVIARQTTQVTGAIRAAGGKSGKGGLIETSGHMLSIGGASVDAGQGGQWLLDPYDLTVDASAASTIDTTLSAGTSVTLRTTASGTSGPGTPNAAGNGDIFIDSAIGWSTAATLTLDAYRSIAIAAPVTVSGAGKVVLTTNDGGTGGDYGFDLGPTGFAGNLSFTGTPNSGQALTINGTPYTLLYSMSDVQNINAGSANLTGKYALAIPLNAASTSNWTPIGGDVAAFNPSSTFSGVFEGLGNTISNLTIDTGSNNFSGLFGSSSGTIRDIGMVGGSVNGDRYVGGLIGEMLSGQVSDAYVTGAVSGVDSIGGLTGLNNGGTITQTYATGAVNGVTNEGGLVGDNEGHISDSHATGTVSGVSDVGGLAGINFTTITNAYSTGSVNGVPSQGPYSGPIESVGGLVGDNDGTITDSYSEGAVSGGQYVGGFVGSNFGGTVANVYATGSVTGGDNSQYVGGLVGWNSLATITNAYSSGAVASSTGSVGGLVGGNDSTGTIAQSYWDTQTTGLSSGVGSGSSGGAAGLTSAQARTRASYVGWDFSGTWFMIDGQTRPFLRSEYSTTITNAHQLQLMAMNLSASYTLANDIDLGPALAADANGNYPGMWGAGGFVPIGNASSPFTGAFDGGSHTIGNLAINRMSTDYVGLFGVLAGSALIENIGLPGENVTGNDYVGGLAGANNGGTIVRSYATGIVSDGYYNSEDDNGANFIGGLVGNNSGTISQSYAVNSAQNIGDGYGGGLVGYNSGTITQSHASGAAGYANSYFGGLAGYNAGTITLSYATDAKGGAIGLGGDSWFGGLVGYNAGTISKSYSSGATGVGDSWFGGLVGANFGSVSQSYATQAAGNGDSWFGGLVGKNASTITQSYAVGPVGSGNSTYGGLVGTNSGTIAQSYAAGASATGNANSLFAAFVGANAGTIATSYWDTQKSPNVNGVGSGSTSGVTGLTTAQLSNGTLPSGFDPAVWAVQVHYYPCLIWQADCSDAKAISPVTYAVGDSSSIYGMLATPGAVTLNGVLASDLSNVAPVLAFYNTSDTAVALAAGLGAGTYTVKVASLAGSAASGYAIAPAGNTYGTLTISPAQLTVAMNDASRTYGDINPALSAMITGFVLGQDASVLTGLTFSTAATQSSNVGGYAISSSGGAAANYVIATRTDGTLTITPATLDVTANALSKVFGTSDPTLSYGDSGLVNGDTASVITGALGRAPGETVAAGPYAIGQGTLSAGANYTIDFTGAAFTITPATLTITANNQSMIYGGTLPTLTASYSGLVNGDTASSLTTAPTVTSATPATANAGSYAGTITAAGAVDSNYTISYAAGTLTIGKATLDVSANALSKVYGAPDPTLTYSDSGLVNGDTASVFAGALSRATGETVAGGPYAVSQGTLSAGANYTIDFTGAAFTITPATLNVTANALSKVYGAPDPTLTYSDSGLVNGDTASVFTGALSRASGQTVAGGPYAIAQGTLSAGTNYTIDFTGANFTITPATLTPTLIGTVEKTYDGTTAALLTASNYSLAGIVGSDNVLLVPITTGSYGSKNAGSGVMVSVSGLALTGTAASNYTLASTALFADIGVIDPASLLITANDIAARSVASAQPTVTYSGFVAGEGPALVSGLSFRFDATPLPTTYRIVPYGAAVPNYHVSYADGALILITGVFPIFPAPGDPVTRGWSPDSASIDSSSNGFGAVALVLDPSFILQEFDDQDPNAILDVILPGGFGPRFSVDLSDLFVPPDLPASLGQAAL